MSLLSPQKEIFLPKDSRTEVGLLSRILRLRHMKPLPVFFPALPQSWGASSQGGYHRQRGRDFASHRLDILPVCLSVLPHHTNPSTVSRIKGKPAKLIHLVFSVWRNGRTTNCVRNYSRSATAGRTRISRRKMADEHCCQWSMPIRCMRKVWVVLIRKNTVKEIKLSMNKLGWKRNERTQG